MCVSGSFALTFVVRGSPGCDAVAVSRWRWRTATVLREVALRTGIVAMFIALGAGLLYVSFYDAVDPPPPELTYAQVEQRLADIAELVGDHVPGDHVRDLAYFTSTCPSQAMFPAKGLHGRSASMGIGNRAGKERLRILARLRDALRADGWQADFPTVINEGGGTQDILEALSPDGYRVTVDAEYNDSTVSVDLEAPCFVLPKG
jgi:hypothetical protein